MAKDMLTDLLVQFGVLWGIEMADSRLNEDKYSFMQAYDSVELSGLFENWAAEYLVGAFDDTVEFFEGKLKDLLEKEIEKIEVAALDGFLLDNERVVVDLGGGYKIVEHTDEETTVVGDMDVDWDEVYYFVLGPDGQVPEGCSTVCQDIDEAKNEFIKAQTQRDIELGYVRDLGDDFGVLRILAERDSNGDVGNVYFTRTSFDMLAKNKSPLFGYCVIDGKSKQVPEGCSKFVGSLSAAVREFEVFDYQRVKKIYDTYLAPYREDTFTVRFDFDSLAYKNLAQHVKGLCDRHFPELSEAAFGSSEEKLFVFRNHLVPTMFWSFRLDSDDLGNKVFFEQTFPSSTAVQIIDRDDWVDVLSKHTARKYSSRTEDFFKAIFYMLNEKFNGRYLGYDVDKVCRSIEQERVENEVYDLLNKAVVNKDEDLYTSPLDVESAEYIEAREKIQEYLEKRFPELAEIVAGDEAIDLIFSDGYEGFEGYYYNPDSNAGGQIVKYTFDEEQLKRIVNGEELINVVAENTQYLSDINTVHFFDTAFELVDKKNEGHFLVAMVDQNELGKLCETYLEKKMDLDAMVKKADQQAKLNKGSIEINTENLMDR